MGLQRESWVESARGLTGRSTTCYSVSVVTTDSSNSNQGVPSPGWLDTNGEDGGACTQAESITAPHATVSDVRIASQVARLDRVRAFVEGGGDYGKIAASLSFACSAQSLLDSPNLGTVRGF